MFVNSPIYASLPAADLERAKRFYAEKVGLTPESEGAGGHTGEVSKNRVPELVGWGEWCVTMRRQGGTQVCDGPVCSARQGEASSLSPWPLQGAQPVNSSGYVRRVDYHQQHEKERTRCSATIQSTWCC